MTEPVDLDGIEARANAATGRPYSHLSGGSAEQRSRDAEFVVSARDDVLALVAEVRALREAVRAVSHLAQDAGDWLAPQFSAAQIFDALGEGSCHCGRPVSFGFDGDPTHHRGMCADCDAVRCDAYPQDCPHAERAS